MIIYKATNTIRGERVSGLKIRARKPYGDGEKTTDADGSHEFAECPSR
jgi:hypothetical protein